LSAEKSASSCTYILLTEQFEVVSLRRHTEPLLIQKIQLVDCVDIGSPPLYHLVGVNRQFLHPADQRDTKLITVPSAQTLKVAVGEVICGDQKLDKVLLREKKK